MSVETILIAEADPTVRRIMAEVVNSLGPACQTAANGRDALNLIRKKDFDIVIAGLDLPETDGLSLMSEIKQLKGEASFVIISGYDQEYSYERIIGAGAHCFIKKPLTTMELGRKLKRIFGEWELAADNRRLLRKQTELTERLTALLDLSADLTSELDFDRLFPLIIGKVTEAMAAERTSLYVIDWETRELWTKVAEQVGEIRVPLGQGISGRVSQTGQGLNVADAWQLPYFNRKYDEKHNFRTKSVLCLPITNRVGERIGVIQVINKKGRDRFDQDDETFLKGLTYQVGIALENALLHEELKLSFDRSISTLSATVDARHPLTAGHSQRVTEYSLLIARDMGQGEEELEVLKYAALLHDIGKIGIRDEVLLKNGSFTPEERAEMNTHPTKTRLILDNFHFPRRLREVPKIAAHHHEKYNGQGYPDGLKDEGIPLGSRIMAVADVFDALTSRRDYPKYTATETFNCDPMPLPKAISIMESEAGNHFDPKAVAAFLNILPQALLLFRGDHFKADYVDEIIRTVAPRLLP